MAASPGNPHAVGPESSNPGLLVAFAPFAKWSPHFETDLEIVQSHLDMGGRAVVLTCAGELHTCEPNPEHRLSLCALCQSRCRQGIAWLRGPGLSWQSFHELDPGQQQYIEQLRRREWRDIDEVKRFTIEGADIGLAAISSIVSLSREPFPDIHACKKQLGEQLATAAMVYFSMSRKLAIMKPDSFSVFNARFAALRPALRAAQQLGVTSYVHDRAGYNERFSLTKGTYPHDLEAIKQEIETCFTQAEPLSAAETSTARSWYEERRAGTEQNWYSFITKQRSGHLPADLDLGLFNLVVFNSSEDEFVAIEEWNNPYYANQNEALDMLLSDLAADKRIRCYLRVHPNMKGLGNSQISGIMKLAERHQNLRVIPADSPVSSYALVDVAGIVLTYGSTIGIEACYAGKPSVLMGRAMYEDLDVCVRLDSHEALVELIRSCASGKAVALPAGHQLGLVKYGHFNRMWGRPYAHVVPDGLFAARMRRGNKLLSIKGSVWSRLVYKLDCLFRLLWSVVTSRPGL